MASDAPPTAIYASSVHASSVHASSVHASSVTPQVMPNPTVESVRMIDTAAKAVTNALMVANEHASESTVVSSESKKASSVVSGYGARAGAGAGAGSGSGAGSGARAGAVSGTRSGTWLGALGPRTSLRPANHVLHMGRVSNMSFLKVSKPRSPKKKK